VFKAFRGYDAKQSPLDSAQAGRVFCGAFLVGLPDGSWNDGHLSAPEPIRHNEAIDRDQGTFATPETMKNGEPLVCRSSAQ
jgi:hypothetical protein